ncbi:outer membrane beta-barrel protein [Bacteroidota bacterium]
MKKIIIFILFSLIAYSSVKAQAYFATDRGSLELGGNIYLLSGGGEAFEDADGNRTFRFNLNPEFMIFVVPSLAVGAELQLSFYSSGDYSNNTVGIGPALTYYIAGHRDQKLYPYVGVSYLFTSYSYNYSSSDSGGDSRNTITTPKLGLLVMLSDAVAMNAEFNYRSYNFDIGDSPESGNELYIGIGIKAFIF